MEMLPSKVRQMSQISLKSLLNLASNQQHTCRIKRRTYGDAALSSGLNLASYSHIPVGLRGEHMGMLSPL